MIAKEAARELIPTGMYPVVCYSVVDLGTQQGEWQGKINWNRKIIMTFEFPTVRGTFEKDGVEKDLPKVLSFQCNMVLGNRSKLGKLLKGWTGESQSEYDLKELIGMNGLATVVHNTGNNGKTYDNIDAIAPLMEGMEHKGNETPFLYYDMDEDREFPNNMPEWMEKLCMKSKELSSTPGLEGFEEMTPPPQDDDDVPF